MKKMSKIFPMLVLALTLMLSSQVNAQSCSTVVGSACVGECSPTGIINYNVGPLCPSAVVNLCVETTSSNLCPSHIAIAKVFVNGVLTARGRITDVGSSISFSAPCGATVKVVAGTKLVDPGIHCVTFGEVHFVLKK